MDAGRLLQTLAETAAEVIDLREQIDKAEGGRNPGSNRHDIGSQETRNRLARKIIVACRKLSRLSGDAAAAMGGEDRKAGRRFLVTIGRIRAVTAAKLCRWNRGEMVDFVRACHSQPHRLPAEVFATMEAARGAKSNG